MSRGADKFFLLTLFSLLVMLALVAAQCGGGAPEAGGGAAAPAEQPAEEKEAAEEPTTTPAEEEAAEEPTEAPAEEETAEEPTAAPAEEEAAEEPVEEEAAATGDFSGLKVALLTSGPINDDGWNQTAYEGLLAVEGAGAEIANTENVAQADQLDLIRSYADQGFNVIIGHGFEYGDAMVQAAEEYPEISFLQIGGIAENGKNLASYVFRPGEGGYAAGIVAGMMVESGKLGGVGAVEIPTIAADFNAFKNAAMAVNPNVSDVPVAYTGSWVDIPKAKEAAIAQIDSGIELIMANGDNANVGAIEAAAENGATYVIGWTRDQSHLGPEVVLTNNEQRVDHILIDAINAIQDGSIEWTNHVVGFAEGAQTLSKFHPDVPEEVAAEAEAVIQAIIDGKIVLDDNGNVVTDEYHK
jgi:basic membrane protein A